MLTSDELRALAAIDSPTVANAIEAFGVRDATRGYASLDLRCQFSDLPPVVGYAVTCTADSTTPAPPRPKGDLELFEAVLAAPKPAIVVLKDAGPNRLLSCHAGDVMSTIFQRVGAIALVTDGGVRDLSGIRQRAPGFQVFAAGTVVSHGIPTILEVGVTVSVCGLTVRPGDLLHGDENGLLVIPPEIASRVAEQAKQVWERESRLVEFVRSEAFSLDELRRRLTH